MTLRDVDPRQLADAAQREALDGLWRRAMAVGVTNPVEPSMSPSELWLAVHQLATYATTGQPPEGRPELAYEYCVSVAEYRDYVDDGGPTQQALDEVLQAAACRDAIASGQPVTLDQLVALSGLSRSHVQRLVAAGDAPQPVEVGGQGRGHATTFAAADARAWLSGRGVVFDVEVARDLVAAAGEAVRGDTREVTAEELQRWQETGEPPE